MNPQHFPDSLLARAFADRWHTALAFIVDQRRWLVWDGQKRYGGRDADALMHAAWVEHCLPMQSTPVGNYCLSLAGWRNVRVLLKLDSRISARTLNDAVKRLDPRGYEAGCRAAGVKP